MSTIEARDRAEEVAIFRHGLISALALREGLTHGELAESLRRISQECYRPPNAVRTRTFSVPTLERWLYTYKKKGLDGLRRAGRSDRGRGRELPQSFGSFCSTSGVSTRPRLSRSFDRHSSRMGGSTRRR